ncbi:S8 family serine peptidase [Streptomyces sp. NPDC020801]|uniref:S53 family peptidase n=1 Tax=unclassified Streptomyces TaxID=2593676 RepID=UPI003789025D
MHQESTGRSPLRCLPRQRSRKRPTRRGATIISTLLTLFATTLMSGGVASAHPLPAVSNRAKSPAVLAPTGSPTSKEVMEFGCAHPNSPGTVGCYGLMIAHRTAAGQYSPTVSGTPTGAGYTPSDLRSAYRLTGTSGSGRTVAIVDAYDDPTAEADLAVYRRSYGLPPCTTANGCFRKVNQNGKTSPLPSGDYGWAEEISLDLDMVSAACPDCHILLVEANSAYTTDLMKAEDQAAATPGVASVSNSWGAPEDDTVTSYDVHLNHPRVAIAVSSGDSGYGVSWPASSPYVTAVGGTTLHKATNARGWSETAWSGAGSGCSAYEPRPAWQHDPACSRRTVSDVSAVADPYTGVATYDTYNNCGHTSLCDTLLSLGLVKGADGWIQVGGTSVASPIIASVYALAGNTASTVHGSYPYSHTPALNDVTSGSNGSCAGSYLCKAGPGYDGPTGLGTPKGTGAF